MLPAVDRLDEVTGIGREAAQAIIAEIGLHMNAFPTAGHLVSWAKLSPAAPSSPGAKNRSGKTGKGNPYLKGVLGEAAAAAGKTDTFLGERYRRLARRRGKLKALVAIARSILVIIWHLLADRTARYHDLGASYHATRIDQEPQDAQPRPPARSPRLQRQPRTRRLNSRFTTTPGSAGHCRAPASVGHFPVSSRSWTTHRPHAPSSHRSPCIPRPLGSSGIRWMIIPDFLCTLMKVD